MRKYFKRIVSKKKKLEARINYSSVRKIKIGDKVRFFWENRSIDVRIIDIRVYQSFKEMLEQENSALLIPGVSKEMVLTEYQKIYPDWKVKKFGGLRVFAFEPL